jgi:beta-N-acetylhexosaminidase
MANLSSTDQDDLMLRACQEMADLGIDMDLAPVLDVAYNPQSPGLGAAERCYSTRASEVKSYAERFCSAATKARLALCLKHYPGLGSAEVDSHADFTVLKHVPEEQTQLFLDLAPRCPGNAILISHGVVPQWDARTPTTMCGPVLSGLRAMLQHTVFISDDMQMQGLLKTRALAQACVDGLAAGLDMLIIGDNLIRLKSNELQEIIDAISDRAARDKIFRASLNLKLTRIERLKSQCRNQSF